MRIASFVGVGAYAFASMGCASSRSSSWGSAGDAGIADGSEPDAVSTGDGQTDAGSPALEGAGQDAGTTNGVHFEGGATADGGEVNEGGATEAGSPIAIPLSTP